MRRAHYPWDDTRDARLKQLFGAGNASYSAIADVLASEFAEEICTNMVQRRCVRIGLSRMQAVRWKPEMDERLRQLTAPTGSVYREISQILNDEFGTSFTRCAVIGRARRIGIGGPILSRSPQDILARRLARQARRNTVRRGQRAATSAPRPRKPRVFRPAPEETIPRCAAIEPQHVSLLDLAPEHCRWPYGEGAATTFCGHQKFNGFSYCAAHYFLSIGPGTGGERSAHKVNTRHLEGA